MSDTPPPRPEATALLAGPGDRLPGLLPEGTIRSGPFVAIPDMLRGYGIEPRDVLAAAGLDQITLEHSENIISFGAAQRLLALAATRTGLPDFGLRAGQRIGMAAIGVIGMAMQNSTSVSEALLLMQSYYRYHDATGRLIWHEEPPIVAIGYLLPDRWISGSDEAQDFALAVGIQIMKSLCGPRWRPTEVWIAHTPPLDERPYQDLIRAPFRFDAPVTRIAFDATWLDHVPTGARPELRDVLLGFITIPASDLGDSTTNEVRRVLRMKVSHGIASLSEVAEELGLHPRTLTRRLAMSGTTFKKLVREIRCEAAMQLLEQTSMNLGNIASLLGYSGAGSFTRAFRSLTGMPPKAWRTRRKR